MTPRRRRTRFSASTCRLRCQESIAVSLIPAGLGRAVKTTMSRRETRRSLPGELPEVRATGLRRGEIRGSAFLDGYRCQQDVDRAAEIRKMVEFLIVRGDAGATCNGGAS